jgi:hypothetical protein
MNVISMSFLTIPGHETRYELHLCGRWLAISLKRMDMDAYEPSPLFWYLKKI